MVLNKAKCAPSGDFVFQLFSQAIDVGNHMKWISFPFHKSAGVTLLPFPKSVGKKARNILVAQMIWVRDAWGLSRSELNTRVRYVMAAYSLEQALKSMQGQK